MARVFNIHYETSKNEEILFIIKRGANGKPESHKTVCDDFIHTFTDDGNEELTYKYALKTSDGLIEERHDRHAVACNDVVINDIWCSPEMGEDVLRASAFSNAIFNTKPSTNKVPTPKAGSLTISLNDPRIAPDEAFCVVSKQFINWNTEKAFVMKRYRNFTWRCEIDETMLLTEFEFKFGIWDTTNNKFKYFENGFNHVVKLPNGQQTIIQTYNAFNYENPWRAAGVAVPVFSLRTTQSRGCGEFADLAPLADWCEQAGLKIIQLLPINDTTATFSWRDSYPYNPISCNALHPNYISIGQVYDYYGKRMPSMEKETGLFLNDMTFYDYNRTSEWKRHNLNYIFDTCYDEIVADKKFVDFKNKNKDWIFDYAAFATLREKFGTANFREWGEYSHYTKKIVTDMMEPGNPFEKRIQYRAFLQFHLDMQLKAAIDHVHSKNIAIKGDLPVGINPNSVEAWVEPDLFDFNLQAGAPPDYFSHDGQNWGFPIYKWDIMEKHNLKWWEKRLERMQQYFDAFRIDHILGFFRIWSIPQPYKSGLMGLFSPAIPMTREEIANAGFSLDPQEYSVPVVTREFINNQLREMADSACEYLFYQRPDGLYTLKPQFAGNKTKEADAWVEDHVPPTSKERIRHGLRQIMHEVLFVSIKNNEWHPRILLNETDCFKRLSPENQGAIQKIHDNYFYHNRHEKFWKDSATKRLNGMLKKCNMLVCGEDLGMIPASVPVVMNRMQILSLELQRMPKMNWERYGDCSKYQYMSVCATSSHDISNIRGWWEENLGESQWYYNNVLGLPGEAPRVATEDIVSRIVEMHMKSPSMLCINPIQDYAGMIDNMPHLLPFEERINQPSDPNHMWKYRVPFKVDELLTKYPLLHQKVRAMVEDCKRL